MRFLKNATGIPIILLCFILFENNVLSAQIKSQKVFSAPQLKKTVEVPDPWLGKDKFDHFLVSAFLTTFSYYSFRENFRDSHQPALQISGGITIGLGIGKEVWDKKSKKGMASFRDLVADLLGVSVGMLICCVSS